MDVVLSDAEYIDVKGDFLRFRMDNPKLFRASITKVNTIIYHYTNLSGLIGIIESQCLFASDIRFVNDKAELRYGLDLVSEVAQTLTSADTRNVLPYLIDNLSHFFPNNRYITCFSTKGDLLQQWQSYANNAMGISIAFDFFSFQKGGPHLIPAVTARKIIYDKKQQIEMIQMQIESTLQFFRESYIDWIADKYIITVVSFMVDAMSDTVASLKHPCFSHENEYRLLYIPENDQNYKINFRTNDKLIVPYIKLETPYRHYVNEMKKLNNDWGDMPTTLENQKLLPIKEITVGAGLDYESTREGIEILLKEHNYVNVKITKSDLPYRV